MSFLSYLSHPVLAVASVGGVSLGVALLLFPPKTVTLGNSPSSPFFTTQVNALKGKGKSQLEQQGTCQVTSDFERAIYKIPHSLEYVEISCEDNKGTASDEILDIKWVALFPIDLFISGKEELSKNKKFSISTVTKIEGEEREGVPVTFETRFKSNKFLKAEIIGNWKYDDWLVTKDIKADIVNLKDTISSRKIYFVH